MFTVLGIVALALAAAVAGLLVDRLWQRRDRRHWAAVERDKMCRHVEATIEERLRADRVVTIERLASSIADEIRNPLGGLLGSIEILAADIQPDHHNAEFLAIARNDIQRLNRVVCDLMDFAHPPPPVRRSANVRTMVEAAVRLAAPTLTRQDVTVQVNGADTTMLETAVDVEQMERALLKILVGHKAVQRHGRIHIAIDHADRLARIIISSPLPMSGSDPTLSDLFEPFPRSAPDAGLTLATARRLIEHQQGTVRAELGAGCVRYVIELPTVTGSAFDNPDDHRTNTALRVH